jgi:hypothetical protein
MMCSCKFFSHISKMPILTYDWTNKVIRKRYNPEQYTNFVTHKLTYMYNISSIKESLNHDLNEIAIAYKAIVWHHIRMVEAWGHHQHKHTFCSTYTPLNREPIVNYERVFKKECNAETPGLKKKAKVYIYGNSTMWISFSICFEGWATVIFFIYMVCSS